MANPNTSEKSNSLDREENLTKGNLSAKKVVLYSYDSGSDTLQPQQPDQAYDLQVEDTGTYTYLGNASPGTATSASTWRIKRVVNATGVITHADGTANFTKTWNNRSGYSY